MFTAFWWGVKPQDDVITGGGELWVVDAVERGNTNQQRSVLVELCE